VDDKIDWDHLTDEQKVTIARRVAEMMTTPGWALMAEYMTYYAKAKTLAWVDDETLSRKKVKAYQEVVGDVLRLPAALIELGEQAIEQKKFNREAKEMYSSYMPSATPDLSFPD
jgi:hypothetical protein